jgi:AcrR family transcriptional regulator
MNISSMAPRGAEVKGRRYDSTRRRQAAAETRDRVLDVAEAALLRDGYAASTLAGIARAAGVSTELIYKAFGGKAGLVREIQRRGLHGAGATPAEARSDDISRGQGDVASVIRGWAKLATEVAPRVSPVILLVRSGAAHDDELTGLLAEIAEQRLVRMTHNAERLTEHTGLRAGLTVEQVRDILWTYSSPDVYDLLVTQRGWTLDAYEEFLVNGMTGQLLPR